MERICPYCPESRLDYDVQTGTLYCLLCEYISPGSMSATILQTTVGSARRKWQTPRVRPARTNDLLEV